MNATKYYSRQRNMIKRLLKRKHETKAHIYLPSSKILVPRIRWGGKRVLMSNKLYKEKEKNES